MVSALAFNGTSFYGPLLAKSSGLGSIAYRAVPLFTIFSVKWMTIFAMSLDRVAISRGVAIGEGIISNCYHSQMRRVNAVSVFAYVVYNHTVSNISSIRKIGYSVSSSVFLAKIKSAVAVFVQRTTPKITGFITIFNLKLAIKSLLFGFGKVIHVPIIPAEPCGVNRERIIE